MPYKDVKQYKLYPKFYHSKPGDDDFKWIMQRLAVVPDIKREEVCWKYEQVYLAGKRNGRKEANTYLQGVAVEYREAANNKRE